MCGYDRCILNLTFHHLDPTTKSFPMSASTGRSLEAFREEAKKCVLLCANCHREIEAALALRAKPAKARKSGPPGKRRVELRSCGAHGVTEFALYGIKQPRWRCKKCNVDSCTKRRRAVRKALVAAAGGRCAICGYARCEWALQFHHVDPETKDFEMAPGSKSRAQYFAELRKCVLLCSNCHGEIEVGLILCPPAGTKFGELEREAVQLSLVA